MLSFKTKTAHERKNIAAWNRTRTTRLYSNYTKSSYFNYDAFAVACFLPTSTLAWRRFAASGRSRGSYRRRKRNCESVHTSLVYPHAGSTQTAF